MKAAEQNENHYLMIFDNITLPIIVFDAVGKIQNLNKEAVKTFFNVDGSANVLSRPEEVAQKLHCLLQIMEEFIRGDQEQKTIRKMLSCYKSECVFDIDIRSLGKKIDEEQGASVMVLRDITDYLKLEAEKHQSEHIMRQQSKMAEMGEMIGAIAHQWRQPLNAIALYVQNIEDRILDGDYNEDKLQKSVENIMASLNYMSKTIDDFRNFFKPDKKEEIFSVHRVIKKVLELVEAQLTNHTIKVEIHGSDFEIKGYPNEFKQAILNLVTNAKEAIIEHQAQQMFEGRIVIKTDDGMISIKDNGTGLSSEVREKIGTPYFTTKGEGTGIGLFMTKSIIEETMQGKFMIHNSDEGAEVKILFQGKQDD